MADIATLEGESELFHFLKVAVPQWSKVRQGGKADVTRVMEKLRSIGVTNARTLVKRIEDGNTINEELAARGYQPIGREAFENIKKQSVFIRSLDSMDTPQVRQVGAFAPVPQMLSGKSVVKGPRPTSSKSPSGGDSNQSAAQGEDAFRRASDVLDPPVLSQVPEDGEDDVMMEPALVNPSWYGCTGPAFALTLREPGLPNQFRKRPVTVDSSMDACRTPMSSSMSFAAMVTRPASVDTTGLGTMTRQLGATSGDNAQSMRLQRSRSVTMTSTQNVESTPSQNQNVLSQADEFDIAMRFRRIGKEMRKQDTHATWLSANKFSPQDQGEKMLEEQVSLDERGRFERLVRPSSGYSDMRTHVAKKIKSRLRQEREHDSTSGFVMQHKFMNIRKNIASLANLRRDISGLRLRITALNEEQQEDEKKGHHGHVHGHGHGHGHGSENQKRKSAQHQSVARKDEEDPWA